MARRWGGWGDREAMKFKNQITGDVLEVPRPNRLGQSVILLNGAVIEQVLYSDVDNSVTLGDGRQFSAGKDFASYLLTKLNPEFEG